MFKSIQNLFQSFRKPYGDEDFDKYEEELEEEEAQEYGQSKQRASYSGSQYQPRREEAHSLSERFGSSTYIEGQEESKRLRIERAEGSKVVPIQKTNKGNEVCIMKCSSFNESQDVCDVLLSNCCAIITLADVDLALAQRIIDFIAGSVYSLNGKLFPISENIFVVAPYNIDVTGDYNDILEQSGYNVNLMK
ncbi:MAG: cell division protein SepF [Lachnospiraceae bacterium]|nr:cell division protein SepF [Lachnospiraceae bacterium]